MLLDLRHWHQPSEVSFKLTRDSGKSMVEDSFITYTSAIQLHCSDWEGHSQDNMGTSKVLLYHTHIYIHIPVREKWHHGEGAGYYPALWMGWSIFSSSDNPKKYKVLDMSKGRKSCSTKILLFCIRNWNGKNQCLFYAPKNQSSVWGGLEIMYGHTVMYLLHNRGTCPRPETLLLSAGKGGHLPVWMSEIPGRSIRRQNSLVLVLSLSQCFHRTGLASSAK